MTSLGGKIAYGAVERESTRAPEEMMERLRKGCEMHGLNQPRADLTIAEASDALAALSRRCARRQNGGRP
jgi:hypothetical protein